MPDWGIVLVALAVVFLFAYMLGYAAGHSSGKVEAIKEYHEIGTSGDPDA